MDALDEIDQQTAWSGRRTYIDLLVEAEKQMQELVKFWKDYGLITGQRAPSSPPIRSPDFFPKSPPPQIRREPITKRLLGIATDTSRVLAVSSQGLRPSSQIKEGDQAVRTSKQLGWATSTPHKGRQGKLPDRPD